MTVRVYIDGITRLEAASDNLAESVYETLMEAIVSGRLRPGTALSALQVSEQMELSRTPVQRALMLLAADGLVEIESGRRARVATFTRDDLYNVFEMRRILESRAAELAAGRMDDRQLRPLRRTMDELVADTDAIDWHQRWTDFDEVFHRTIAESSGNPLLAKDIGRYRLLHRGFNRISTNVPLLQQAWKEHDEILSALEARDGDEARDAMDRHISNWQAIFVEMFPQQQ
ncbi:MAG: FCD domain-containing protein [Phycisphaera sp.]|nr:FCD domain-containing protein [Phycisphaera sp.]